MAASAVNPKLAATYLALLSYFLFSVADTFSKTGGIQMPFMQLIWIGSFFALSTALIIASRQGSLRDIKTRRPLIHVVRLSLFLISLFAGFWGLLHLPLAITFMLRMTLAIMLPLLGLLILQESVAKPQWIGIFVGFIGAAFVIQPNFSEPDMHNLLAYSCILLSVLMNCINVLIVRKYKHENKNLYAVSPHAIAFLTSSAAILVSGFVPVPWEAFLCIAAAGVIGGAASVFITYAYTMASTSYVAPFQYTQIVWGILLGWIVWNDMPGLSAFAGSALIVVSGLYLLHWERKRLA